MDKTNRSSVSSEDNVTPMDKITRYLILSEDNANQDVKLCLYQLTEVEECRI